MSIATRGATENQAFSPREAAFITGLSAKAVNKAIDERWISIRRVRAEGSVSRRIGETELVYLCLLTNVSELLRPSAKKELYRRLRRAPSNARKVDLDGIAIDISRARREARKGARRLRHAVRVIVCDPEIRGGEPVIRGTRVPAYTLADLAKQGVPAEEILEDYPSIDRAKLDAALAYAQAYPRRGRPPRRPWVGASRTP